MREIRQISARQMGAIVKNDPQMRLPVKPRFIPGLVTIPLRDGIIIEGTAERQVLRGRAASVLLPRLLPLLDGARDLEAVTQALSDVHPQAITNAVALLYSRGLLDDAESLHERMAESIPQHVVAYLLRHVDTTRINKNGFEAAARLRTARVAVVGDYRISAVLVDELVRVGITAEFIDGPGNIPASTTLVVAVGLDLENSELLIELDQQCRRMGKTWLRAAIGQDGVDIGPVFGPHSPSCYNCFASTITHDKTPGNIPDWRIVKSAAVLSIEIVAFLSGVGEPTFSHGLSRFNWLDWTQTTYPLAPRPGCYICFPVRGLEASDSYASVEFAFEHSVKIWSKFGLNRKHHQVHYSPTNLLMQRESKDYKNSPRIKLPQIEQPQAGSLTRINDDVPTTLGWLFQTGVGIRHKPSSERERVQRWAATGGNLGSVQAYLLCRDSRHLPEGVYYYDPLDHCLQSLPTMNPVHDAQSLFEGIKDAQYHSKFGLCIVLTSALWRLFRKYGPNSYRIAHLDAGVAVAQLQILGREIGLPINVSPRWNDVQLIASLNIEDFEPITAVLYL